MAISTVDEFLGVLERSKLLKPEQVSEARRLAQDSADPQSLAKTLVRLEMLTRWQAGQLLAGRSTFFLGKYKLIELLGRGGMGSVFLSEHVMMNRRVALKIIPRQIGKDPAGLERFLAEARTIAALDHPNIVQAYNVDNEGDLYYLVMEYVEGFDLQRLVEAEGPLDSASAVDYMRQAAEGLAHAHARKMVHCDIKPSNLIINPQGVVKILDMGLARLAGPEQLPGESSQQDDQILGSVDYLAPEQAIRGPDFDHRADIYSLGCTLYFLLVGHPPFPEGTLTERILKHQTEQPLSISAQRPDVPSSLIEICKKMMAKRPADRYQTAAELIEVLASWWPGEKLVQRVMELKKAEPIDELPGPNLLGMDISELFRKGMVVPTAAPKIIKKPSETAAEKFLTGEQTLFGTPQRMMATLTVIALVLLLFALVISNPIGRTERPSLDQGTHFPTVTQPLDGISHSPATGIVKQEPVTGENQKSGQDTRSTSTSAKPPAPPEPEPQSQVIITQEPTHAEEPVSAEVIEPAAAEPPKIEPFKDMPERVNLPDLPRSDALDDAANKKTTLGQVHLPQGTTMQIVLIGGSESLKGPDFIIMRQDPDAQLWYFYYGNVSQEAGKPTKYKQYEIAQMTLQGENLLFNWMPDVTPATAESLKRCGLLAAVLGEEHFILFARAREAKPLVIDMDKGSSKESFSFIFDATPELSSLRLQILDREGAFPPNELKPSDIIEAKFEGISETNLVFTDEKLSDFKVKITLEVKGQRLDLEAVPIYSIPGQSHARTFKAKEVQEKVSQLLKQQNRIKSTLDELPNNSPRKITLAPQLEQVNKSIEFFKELGELYKALNKQGKIHYSLFVQQDKFRIELFNSKIPSAESETQKSE